MKYISFALACLLMGACGKAPQPQLYEVEELFADSAYQVVGVAVSKSGRLFSNYMGGRMNNPYSVVEVIDGKPVHYPDEAWNAAEGSDLNARFVRAQAVTVDADDYLWVVDPGGRSMDPADNNRGQKIVKIDLNTDKVMRVYPLSDVATGRCSLNDMRIDTKKQMAYLSNSGSGGLVVVNLRTGEGRHVLEDSWVTQADTNYVFKSQGVPLKRGDRPYRTNTDGIALTPDGKTVYFKALSDDRLFRVPAEVLCDFSLSDEEIEKQVEFLGHFTTTDGMEFDQAGNLYLGDLENRRIVRITPDLTMEEIIAPNKDLLPWPDSYQLQGDYLYISCSRIDDQPQFHGGVMPEGHYKILRMRIK